MKFMVSLALIVVGGVHLLPLGGFAGREALDALYGVPFTDANLEILMRHRAVLFGLLGAFLVLAAFRPVYQPVAFAAGFVSVASFLYLAVAVGDYNDAIARVLAADLVALACLVAGLAAWLVMRARQSPSTA